MFSFIVPHDQDTKASVTQGIQFVLFIISCLLNSTCGTKQTPTNLIGSLICTGVETRPIVFDNSFQVGLDEIIFVVFPLEPHIEFMCSGGEIAFSLESLWQQIKKCSEKTLGFNRRSTTQEGKARYPVTIQQSFSVSGKRIRVLHEMVNSVFSPKTCSLPGFNFRVLVDTPNAISFQARLFPFLFYAGILEGVVDSIVTSKCFSLFGQDFGVSHCFLTTRRNPFSNTKAAMTTPFVFENPEVSLSSLSPTRTLIRQPLITSGVGVCNQDASVFRKKVPDLLQSESHFPLMGASWFTFSETLFQAVQTDLSNLSAGAFVLYWKVGLSVSRDEKKLLPCKESHNHILCPSSPSHFCTSVANLDRNRLNGFFTTIVSGQSNQGEDDA